MERDGMRENAAGYYQQAQVINKKSSAFAELFLLISISSFR